VRKHFICTIVTFHVFLWSLFLLPHTRLVLMHVTCKRNYCPTLGCEDQFFGRGLPNMCEISSPSSTWITETVLYVVHKLLKLEIHNSNNSSLVCIFTYFTSHFCLVLTPIDILYVVCCKAMDISA
jgi:hypothetical protein